MVQFKELTLREDRLISGVGSLRLDERPRVRLHIVLVDVVRLPEPDYRNYTYTPDRGEYCNISYIGKGYVQKDEKMNYARKMLYIPKIETTGWLLPYLNCWFGSLDSLLSAIALQVGLPPAPPTEIIGQWIQLPVDRLVFTCRGGGALQVRNYELEMDDSCDNAPPVTDQPFEPVPPLPQIPPGTGVDISAPYANDPYGEQFYAPDPIDEEVTPPPQRWRVFTKGLNSDCTATSETFQAEYEAQRICWDRRNVPAGQAFAGCPYDFLLLDGVSRYPDLAGGSFPGSAIIQRIDANGNILQVYPPGECVPQ